MPPRVSVLMTVFNNERFLRQAVESILGQTFDDFEFLIVDDGSLDGSPAILDEYARADARVKVIHCLHNRGHVYAANDGLSHVQGEYVARMDADDVSLPERLARQVQFLDEHPEIGVAGTWFR